MPPTPHVTHVGEVPSVAPYLAAASVVAIPLRHGGGTRLKLLEALAWGRPVVTTTKGAEGLDVRHEREVLVADTGRAFAEAVVRAWIDVDLAAVLGERGRRFVTPYYWDRVGTLFAAAVDQFAAEASAAR